MASDRILILDPTTVELEPWSLSGANIVSGAPKVSGRILDIDADGRVERGIWQHTEGVSRGIETDELFVVLEGRATIEVEGGPIFDIGPGDVGIFRAGDHTTWRVHSKLRKVFQVTHTDD